MLAVIASFRAPRRCPFLLVGSQVEAHFKAGVAGCLLPTVPDNPAAPIQLQGRASVGCLVHSLSAGRMQRSSLAHDVRNGHPAVSTNTIKEWQVANQQLRVFEEASAI
ncbi:hypothetical protein GQ53DRAFT_425173 [Thozetella sp. PMI_491]|nr:hypothetical protein GQ53DRAFT_425173 [Thozetella sp. PMI_491]